MAHWLVLAIDCTSWQQRTMHAQLTHALCCVFAGSMVECPAAFTVENTGNVNMQFTAMNTSPALNGTSSECSATDMAPGAVVTCDLTYAVTQPDREQGFAMLTAAVAGGQVLSSSDAGLTYAATSRLDVIQTIGMEFSLEDTSTALHAGNGEWRGAVTYSVAATQCVKLRSLSSMGGSFCP